MPSDNLTTLIKKIALSAVRSSKPVAVEFGVVRSVSPLSILVGQRLQIDEDFLVVTSTARASLSVGARVLLIRKEGGQRYAVIDTIA